FARDFFLAENPPHSDDTPASTPASTPTDKAWDHGTKRRYITFMKLTETMGKIGT
ncbi:hypothetical protein A2U01_0064521, partial [Trifolium medium]|nr:hypothetical protein [Trifolium medium]